MQNTDMAKSHLIPNKMDIKLNVLGATMMNRVGGEVDGGDVVAVDYRGLLNRTRELVKKLTKPGALSNNVSHSVVLSLGARPRDGGLPLGRPRHQGWSKEDAVTRSRRRVSGQPAQSASE